MQRHESYKPSGVKWLGEVPSHWEVRPGFTCFDENKDRNKKLTEKTVLSLSYGRIVVKSEEKMTGLVPESFDTYQLIKPGDIVIRTTDLQNDKTSLRVGLAKDKGMITSAYLGLRCRPEINPEYVFRLLESYDSLKVFYGMGSGLRQNIDFWDFKRLPVPLPLRSEQDRIVEFLKQKTSEIDAAISKKRNLIELLQEQKAIEINQAITKGLNPDCPMALTDDKWLKAMPVHWHLVPLLSIADVIDPNPSHRNPKYTDFGFPFVSTVEFKGDDDILLDSTRRVAEVTVLEQERRCSFSAASIGFSRKGTIGSVRRLPVGPRFALLDSLCVINVKEGVNVQFVYRQLGANFISAQYGPVVRGAALKQLSVGRVRALKALLPPELEQIEIARYIDGRLAEINGVIRRVRIQIDQLAEFRHSLICSAVTGQIKI